MRTTRRIYPIALIEPLWRMSALGLGSAILLCALSEAAGRVDTTHQALFETTSSLSAKPVLAMLDSVVVVALVTIVTIVFLIKRAKKKHHERVLNVAWHEVLNDPHYTERRHLEERKHVVEKERELAALDD